MQLNQLQLAVPAFKKLVIALDKKAAENKNNNKKVQIDFDLSEDDLSSNMYVDYELFNIPSSIPQRPHQFVLPNEIYPRDSRICLITTTKMASIFNKPENEKIADKYEKILDIDWCKRNFVPYQKKRSFAHSYDLYAIDTAVYQIAVAIFGKALFNSCATVIIVNSEKILSDNENSLKKLLSTALVKPATGHAFSVFLGRIRVKEEKNKEIEKNIMELHNFVIQRLQGGIKNVRVVYLRTGQEVEGAPRIPIYKGILENNNRIIPKAPLRKPDILDTVYLEAKEALKEEGLGDFEDWEGSTYQISDKLEWKMKPETIETRNALNYKLEDAVELINARINEKKMAKK